MEQPQLYCCIGNEPVSPPYHMLGGRVYCDRHFAQVNKPHAGFWRSAVVMIVAIGLASGVLAFLLRDVHNLDHTTLIIAGVILAIVPTILWTYYFYRQDNLEPEPKERIVSVLVTAMIFTDFIGLHVILQWFNVAAWTSYNTWTSLASNILISGFIYTAVVYAAIRVWVYNTQEYDERMDGIVYGTIAGLGVATTLNLHYVLGNQGVVLAPGVISIVTTALAQASFGGVFGYFMAQAKFAHKPEWWMPLGVCVASVLNGVFGWLINEVSSVGLTVEPWRSLAFGIVVTIITFAALVYLMQRADSFTLRRTPNPQ